MGRPGGGGVGLAGHNHGGRVGYSSQAVWNEGVVHGDECDPNILWNEECGCIMLIDFDRATLWPPVKHKKVLDLSSIKRKPRNVLESDDPKHLVMNGGRRVRESVPCNGLGRQIEKVSLILVQLGN